jgi:hypothetical protein
MDHTFLLIPDVYDGLKCMKFLEIPPTNETLREYIIPNLLKHSKKETPENTLEKLSSYTGVSLTVIVPAAIQHLLSENDSQSVARFGMFPTNSKSRSLATTTHVLFNSFSASKYRLRFGSPQLRRSVIDSYLRNKDAKTFVQIIGNSG